MKKIRIVHRLEKRCFNDGSKKYPYPGEVPEYPALRFSIMEIRPLVGWGQAIVIHPPLKDER